MDFAVFVQQSVDTSIKRFLALGGGGGQRHQHAVLVPQVVRQAETAGLLAAEQRVVLGHRLGDPLEADGDLVDVLAVGLGDAVDDAGRRDRPTTSPVPSSSR